MPKTGKMQFFDVFQALCVWRYPKGQKNAKNGENAIFLMFSRNPMKMAVEQRLLRYVALYGAIQNGKKCKKR